MAKSIRRKSPKTILKLPDLEQSKTAVLNSLVSPSSRRSYDHAIRDFIDWYCSELCLAFNRTVVTRYRISLEQRRYAPATINLRLAAVRRLAYEASDCGLLSSDLAPGIRRVKGAKRLGVRVGNWLSAEQGKTPISAPAGLVTVDAWLKSANLASGTLFRSVAKTGKVWGSGFTAKVIYSIVRKAASDCGFGPVAPHDLRRTCARLCHQAGGELEQKQFLLGHVFVQTTERYLGCNQRLQNAVNDRIGLEPEPP